LPAIPAPKEPVRNGAVVVQGDGEKLTSSADGQAGAIVAGADYELPDDRVVPDIDLHVLKVAAAARAVDSGVAALGPHDAQAGQLPSTDGHRHIGRPSTVSGGNRGRRATATTGGCSDPKSAIHGAGVHRDLIQSA
jgi:hypothetical protein